MLKFNIDDLTSIEAVQRLRQAVATDLRFLDMLIEEMQQRDPAPRKDVHASGDD